MKRAALYALMLTLLAGCQQEDWQTVEMSLPEGVSAEQAQSVLVALDSQTPPTITRHGAVLHIRYNALRVAPANFAYELRQLQPRPSTP